MKLRQTRNPKLAELKKLKLFAGLGNRRLEALAQNLDEITVPAGERFVREGRHNDTFWIILEGSATLTVGGRVTETLGPGDIVGAPSMFSGLESTADVVAQSPLRALVASHQQFNGLVSDSEVEIRFKASLFDRLRDQVYQLSRGPRSASAGSPAPAPAKKAAPRRRAAPAGP